MAVANAPEYVFDIFKGLIEPKFKDAGMDPYNIDIMMMMIYDDYGDKIIGQTMFKENELAERGGFQITNVVKILCGKSWVAWPD